MLERNSRIQLMIAGCGKVSILSRQSYRKTQARHVIALSKLSLSPRDIPLRVANATHRSGIVMRRSGETGENCIDNMVIAWMAVNLSLNMIRWQRKVSSDCKMSCKRQKTLYCVEYK